MGDLLGLASEHIEAVTRNDGRVPPEAAGAAIQQLHRLIAAMSRSADAFVMNDQAEHAMWPDAQAQAVRDARSALRHAATRMSAAIVALGDSNGTHPVVGQLAAAADCLAAGHDLLQTHFNPGPFGSRVGSSPWAPVIVSIPVNMALVAEMASYARRLAPWALQLAATGQADGERSPRAHAAVGAACRWLRLAEAAAWAAGDQQGSPADRSLLHAIPVNMIPPRYPPNDEESVAALCAGIKATAERLRHLCWASAARGYLPEVYLAASWQRTAHGVAAN